MADTSPCTRIGGSCCSKCTAPAVTTELISGDPWPALFIYGTGWETGFNGSGTTTSVPWVYTFTVLPGDTLPYYQVEFDNGDFDWDPSAVVITDEDGNIVTPDQVWAEEQDFTITVDPAAMQDEGDYTGAIRIKRSPTLIPNPDPDDDTVIEGTHSIEEICSDTPYVRHAKTEPIIITILPAHAATVHVQFPLQGLNPFVDCNGDPLTANWEVSIDITLAGGASYIIQQNGVGTIAEDTSYGPVTNNSWFFLQLALTHAGLVAGADYTGTITITSEFFTSTRTLIIRDRTDGSAAPGHSFEIQSPGAITRGTAFDLVVHAIDNTTGVIDASYNGGEVRLNLSSFYSPADVLTFEDYDASNLWVNGVLTIPDVEFDSGVGGWPFLQVFEYLTGNYGVYQFNGATFLTAEIPAQIQRGVAFDLDIAMDDPTYVPANPVTIVLTSPDGADGILPATTSVVGWVNGAKTEACTITGGSGADAISVEAEDTDLSLSGSDTSELDDAVSGSCPYGGAVSIRWNYFSSTVGWSGWYAPKSFAGCITIDSPGTSTIRVRLVAGSYWEFEYWYNYDGYPGGTPSGRYRKLNGATPEGRYYPLIQLGNTIYLDIEVV